MQTRRLLYSPRCIGVAPLWVGSGKTWVRRSPSTSLTRGRLQTFTPPSSTLPRSLNRLFKTTRRHLQRRACRREAVSVTANLTKGDKAHRFPGAGLPDDVEMRKASVFVFDAERALIISKI